MNRGNPFLLTANIVWLIYIYIYIAAAEVLESEPVGTEHELKSMKTFLLGAVTSCWLSWSSVEKRPLLNDIMLAALKTHQWYQSLAICHNSCLLHFSPGILLASPLPDCLLRQSAICMRFSLTACAHLFVCVILFSFASSTSGRCCDFMRESY